MVRKSYLAQVLDQLTVAVTITNSASQFVYANPAFSTMYGWREEEIIGLRPMILQPPGLSEAELSKVRKHIATPDHCWSTALPNRTKDGSVITIELAAFHIGLIGNMPANLWLGIITKKGEICQAVNELTSSLTRSLFQYKAPKAALPPSLPRHKQITALQRCGYSIKEIAAIMGVEPNTPHVILHRAKRKKR